MFRIIKEIRDYYKLMKIFKTINFSEWEMVQLKNFNKLEDKIINKVNEKLILAMLKDDISQEFLRWFKIALIYRKSIINRF